MPDQDIRELTRALKDMTKTFKELTRVIAAFNKNFVEFERRWQSENEEYCRECNAATCTPDTEGTNVHCPCCKVHHNRQELTK